MPTRPMKQVISPLLKVGICTVGYLYASSNTTLAQVTSDGTVNTQVDQNGNVAEIVGGETRGSNLFHSFQDFSVGTGNEAFFNNANVISNIFSRVTGGNISNIDGLIRANGSANLFLINPAGIIFGQNARLDIGGSFYGSSADSILFPDDIEFSASDTSTPILTINAPIGLGFRDNPGDITVRGDNDRVFSSNEALNINPESTLALVGGNVNLQGAEIGINGGRLEIGSIVENEQVTFFSTNKGYSLGYENVQNFNDINFSETRILDLNSGSGSIRVRGKNITLTNSSLSLIDNSLPGDIANIDINASETLIINSIDDSSSSVIDAEKIDISASSIDFNSALITTSTSGATNSGNITVNITNNGTFDISNSTISAAKSGAGNGGGIDINAGLIDLNSSFILTSTSGTGNAGHITINTNRNAINLSTSRIQAGTSGAGNAGLIEVTAGNLTISNDSQIRSTVSLEATGNGGEIIFDTENLSLTNGGEINVSTNGQGNAGTIKINTSNLSLIDGGEINASTLNQGNAGDIEINATGNIILSGEDQFGSRSAIRNRVEANAVGDAGNIEIATTDLSLINGGVISASTNGQGNGGAIIINATDSISLDGKDQTGFRSSILNRVEGSAVGNAGNIEITTGNLSLTDEGRISATVQNPQSQGNGGNIEIATVNLNLINGGRIRAGTEGLGDAGSIEIDASNNIFIDGNDLGGGRSAIRNRVEPTGVGDAGNIKINAPNLSLVNGGVISASTQGKGNGGSIIINTSDRISIDGEDNSGFRSSILNRVEVDAVGNAGDINLTTSNLSLTNGGRVSATVQSPQAQGNAGDINITATDINLVDNGEINVSALGEGDGGNIFIEADGLELDNSRIFAINRPSETNVSAINDLVSGNVTLELTNDLILRDHSLISARAFQKANGGNLDINTRFIIAFPDGNNDIIANAQQGNGGNININAESLFGIQERSLNDLTNDINASSEFSLDGNVTLNTPDINPVQGATELPSNVVKLEQTTAQACAANRARIAKNGLNITGKGGIPPAPDLPLNSYNISINGEYTNSTSAIPQPIETSQGKIQPARGIKITESGKVILTAYRTNNSGERLPANSINCSQV